MGSLELGQVALLCLLLPGSKISQSFKLAHFDAPQLKRGGKRKKGRQIRRSCGGRPERGGSGGLENVRDECEGGVKEE